MNRRYRLVWNRALRVVQVASELSSSPPSPSLVNRPSISRLTPLGLALAACGMLAVASPTWAQVCAQCGAAGGAATSDRAASGGWGNGQGGSAQNISGSPHVEISGDASSAGTGGNGATGVDVNGAAGPTGGAGGGVGTEVNGVTTGGQGADGAFSTHIPSGGGGGGAGVYDVSGSIVTGAGTVMIGGAGGAGGAPDEATGGSGGGGGGAGMVLAAAGAANLTVGVSSSLTGGAGGHGGQAPATIRTFGGGGGGGGDGLLILGVNANVTLTDPTSLVRGGAGGAGGIGNGASNGLDGDAGAGIRALGLGLSLVNAGTIEGGDATGTGLAGSAVITQANALIINGGTLSGGVANGAHASSVVFNGTGGNLILEPGSVVEGAVELASGAVATIGSAAASAIDGAKLGGGASLSLDLSQDLDMGRAIIGSGNVSSSNTGRLTMRGLLLGGNADFAGSGTVLVMDGAMQTSGSQHYAAPVRVGQDTTFASSASSIAFDGPLDTTGATHALTVSAPLGAVTFGNTVGSANQPSLTVAANSLSIGAVNASALTLGITGDIFQSGAFSVAGASRFASGGDVVLANAANAFGGAVSLQARDAAVVASGNLAIDSIDVGGTGNIALSAGGTLTFAAPVSTTGGIALSGGLTSARLTGHDVFLNATGDFTQGDDLTASGLLTLRSTANVTQVAGAIQADTLTATTAGALSLNGASNAIATVGDVNATSFSLANSTSLTFAGAVQVDTFELAAALGATVTGSIVATTGATLDAGTLLAVGDGGTSGSFQGNLANFGTLLYNRTDTGTFNDTLSGNGSLVSFGGGNFLFDGDGSSFTGSSLVLAGELVVGSTAGSSATLGGSVDVASGAALGGHGQILGNVRLDGGSTLSPGNSIGTLSVQGDLTMAQGSAMVAELGASGAGDKVEVGGNLELDGVTLDVMDAGGMGPGVYNLFAYGGSLTLNNGGLILNSLPAGQQATLQVLTGDKRINLVDSTGATLSYWNANGLADATHAGGGSGTWSVASPNWTDAQASVNGPMTPQPGFAIFGGAPGIVTVDDGNGAVTTTGMQFLSDGYRVTGNALGLVASGGPVTIRVGDGSESSSGYVASVDAVLTGTQGFTKADAGTLVLSGANLYSGDTTISGGHLQVSDDANLGNAANGVMLQGGTLRVTGTGYNVTGRNLSVLVDGGIEVADAGNAFAWNGNVSGAGTLHKLGAGTLVFDHANTLTGPLIVEQGTLRVGDSGAIGSGALTVRDGATFEAGADGMTFTNAVRLGGRATMAVNGEDTLTLRGDLADDTKPGTLVKSGSGTLALTAKGTYTGGTEVEAGTLSLSDGGAAGTGTIAMQDGSTLVLAQDGMSVGNAVTVAGNARVDVADVATLSGDIGDGTSAGGVTKTGAGTLTLTGNTTYSGITTIADGTLRVGDGGTRGTLPSTIVNHSVLLFDRADDVEYAGSMSGDGVFRKGGAGVLHLTGDSAAFTGASSIDGGTLQLDGALGGNLALAEGTALTGTGAAGSATVAAGATLSPGGAGAIGALAFRGDLNMANGSRYLVDVSDVGKGDYVTVDGHARLGGGSVVSVGTGANWSTNKTYTILSAAGGVDGRFGDVSNNLAFLAPSLAYTANTVVLTLSRNQTAFPDVAATRNQRATAAAAESLGGGVAVYDAILRMDAAGAQRAIGAFSGEIHANLRGAVADDDRYQRDSIRQHLLNIGDDNAGAWASAWGHWGDHDGDGNASRLRANGSGVMVGADAAVGGDARIGVALGTGHLSASAGRDDAQGDTRTAAVYGSGQYGNVSLQAGAIYSHRDIDTHRTVEVDTITGRLNGSQRARSAQAYVEGAYSFRFDRGSLDPFLNVARQQLRTGALHEHGSEAALDVMGEKSAQTLGTAGLRGRWDISAQGNIGLFGSVGWQHAWGDTDTLSRQRFAAGGSAFVVAGTPVAENAGVATFGLRFRPWASVTVDASYVGQFATQAKDQSARLNMNWVF